jgi:hypothetical protein
VERVLGSGGVCPRKDRPRETRRPSLGRTQRTLCLIDRMTEETPMALASLASAMVGDELERLRKGSSRLALE